MEYIQCTHCGKRYAVSEQVRGAAGKFTTCKLCGKKFLIVLHSDKKTKATHDDSVISTGSWDPSLTMSDDEPKEGSLDAQFINDGADDDWADEDDGVQVLAALQAKRKKQRMIYMLIAIVVCILLVSGWFFLQADNHQDATVVNQQVSRKVQHSAKEVDRSHAECRQAAARQWLLDSKVMHTQYSAEAFVRMLELSEQQTAQLHKVCKQKHLTKDIIQAATERTKPDWFKAEIEAFQDQR